MPGTVCQPCALVPPPAARHAHPVPADCQGHRAGQRQSRACRGPPQSEPHPPAYLFTWRGQSTAGKRWVSAAATSASSTLQPSSSVHPPRPPLNPAKDPEWISKYSVEIRKSINNLEKIYRWFSCAYHLCIYVNIQRNIIEIRRKIHILYKYIYLR